MVHWYCKLASENPIHTSYHDNEYGFPVVDERILFERLCLEVMQAGLSWEIVLKKRKALNKAFHGFRVSKVAAYGAKDIQRLLKDKTIIRNRLKVKAVVANAVIIQNLRKTHGGFAAWLESQDPKSKAGWIKLFRKTFKFTGKEITNEFLMSIGYLPGAHGKECPVNRKIRLKKKAVFRQQS